MSMNPDQSNATSASSGRVVVLRDPGDVWPAAEDLAVLPSADLATTTVELEGRRISAAELVSAFRFTFGS